MSASIVLRSLFFVLSIAAIGISPTGRVAHADPAPFTWTVDKQTFSVTSDGLWSALIEVERTANTPAAARSSLRIDIPYSATLQTLEIVEAATVKADGKRLDVSPDRIMDIAPQSSSRGPLLYSDSRTRSLVFPGVEAGDSIRYKYKLTKHEHTWPKFSWNYFWNSTAADAVSERIVEHPDSMTMVVEHSDSDYRLELSGNLVRHTWSRPKARRAESGAVSGFDYAPRFAISGYHSYAEIGEYYARLHNHAASPTAEVVALADQIAGVISDKSDQARALYSWVRENVRYVGISIGQEKLVPKSSSFTLRDRYGDCKAQTALLSALLAARGIRSEPVLVSVESSRYSLPNVPIPAFDHVILFLPDLRAFLDPTWAGSFGILNWNLYGKPGLVASADNSHMVRLPNEVAEDNVSELHTVLHIGPEGEVRGQTRETGLGTFGGDLRTRSADLRLGKVTRTEAYGFEGTGGWLRIFGDANASKVEVESRFLLTDKIDLTGPVSFAPPVGLRLASRVGSFLMGGLDQHRTLPFPCHAGRQIEQIVIHLPSNMPPPRLPADRSWSTSVARYTSSYKYLDGKIDIRREFQTTPKTQVCQPDKLGNLAMLLANVRRDLRASIGLNGRSMD